MESLLRCSSRRATSRHFEQSIAAAALLFEGCPIRYTARLHTQRRLPPPPCFRRQDRLVRCNDSYHPQLWATTTSCHGSTTICTRKFSSSHDAINDDSSSVPSHAGHDIKSMEIPGAQHGGRKLAIVFTCTVCDTRSAKQFTERAYTHGVVIVRCPGCQNLHLIADRLGYFENDGDFDLDTIARMTGQDVKRVSDEQGVLELSLEELVGTEKYNELVQKADGNVT